MQLNDLYVVLLHANSVGTKIYSEQDPVPSLVFGLNIESIHVKCRNVKRYIIEHFKIIKISVGIPKLLVCFLLYKDFFSIDILLLFSSHTKLLRNLFHFKYVFSTQIRYHFRYCMLRGCHFSYCMLRGQYFYGSTVMNFVQIFQTVSTPVSDKNIGA